MLIALDQTEIDMLLDALIIAYEDHDRAPEAVSLRERLSDENNCTFEEFLTVKTNQIAKTLGVPASLLKSEALK